MASFHASYPACQLTSARQTRSSTGQVSLTPLRPASGAQTDLLLASPAAVHLVGILRLVWRAAVGVIMVVIPPSPLICKECKRRILERRCVVVVLASPASDWCQQQPTGAGASVSLPRLMFRCSPRFHLSSATGTYSDCWLGVRLLRRGVRAGPVLRAAPAGKAKTISTTASAIRCAIFIFVPEDAAPPTCRTF